MHVTTPHRRSTHWLLGLIGIALAHTALAQPTASPADTTAATLPDALPLWEIGIAAAAASVPDYPGADRHRIRALPVPYAIYRGRTLRAGDGGGVRSRYRFSPTVELDLSVGGALPANSDGNPAREGMPDLDLLLEIGPQLKLVLAQPSPQSLVTLAVPVRAVFSTDFSDVESRGVLVAPLLSYVSRKVGGSDWNLRLSAGTKFATAPLTAYFYEVGPEFARADRPAYQAKAGYVESSFTAGVSRTFFDRLTLFTFARAASLHGSANADSPLLREDLNLSGGIGFAYILRRSSQTVSAEDDSR